MSTVTQTDQQSSGEMPSTVVPEQSACNKVSCSHTPLQISIERLNIVGHWHLPETGVTDHICNLCKRDIMAPSFDNLTKGKKSNTKITMGKCRHCFHTDCIETMLKSKATSSCPICGTPWNVEKELDSNTYHKQLKPIVPQTSDQSDSASGQSVPILKRSHKMMHSIPTASVTTPTQPVSVASVTAPTQPISVASVASEALPQQSKAYYNLGPKIAVAPAPVSVTVAGLSYAT
jgi:hypothetical protein